MHAALPTAAPGLLCVSSAKLARGGGRRSTLPAYRG